MQEIICYIQFNIVLKMCLILSVHPLVSGSGCFPDCPSLSLIHFLSVHLSVYMSVILSICLLTSLCLDLSVHPSVFLLGALSLSLAIKLSLSLSPPARLSLCLSVCLSLWVFAAGLSVRITRRQVGQHGRQWWGNKMFLSAQSRSNPLSSPPHSRA